MHNWDAIAAHVLLSPRVGKNCQPLSESQVRLSFLSFSLISVITGPVVVFVGSGSESQDGIVGGNGRGGPSQRSHTL